MEKEPDSKTYTDTPSLNLNYIPIILIIIILIAGGLFILTNTQSHTQTVEVDGVSFEIPDDYKSEPLRDEVSYDENVKSTSKAWSNEKCYIEIGVVRTPGEGFNSQLAASQIGGSPTKMYNHTGYYLEYPNEGYAFVFGMKDKVCMVYVSNYTAFDDIHLITSD